MEEILKGIKTITQKNEYLCNGDKYLIAYYFINIQEYD